MKALTNILTHMLMLLLMLVVMAGCTNDEMADIVVPTDEGLVQLTVSMSVPELKLATRADEGEALTSITALAFDANKKLIKISTATDITANTFKVSVTDDTRFIHFLANTNELPTNSDIGKAMDEVLISLNTQNTSLAYWGHHHFNGTPSNCTINFYRNQAKIEIVAIEGYDGELAIAGVMNALDQSSLVPYNPELEGETYAFNPADKEYDFYTLPTFYNRQNIFFDEEPTSCYVFEHPNTGNSMPESLIVICNIGGKYYKVALGESSEDDGMVTGHYYPIIRNHKYLIQVADTEDIDPDMGADTPEALAEDSNKRPINDDDIKVTDIVDVPLQVSTAQSSVSYAGTTFDVMVNNLGSVNTLTMTLPEGIGDVFEISNNADLKPTINENERTYNSSNISNIVFTFTMKEEYIGKGTEANIITFTGDGGEKVNVLSASTTLALIPFADTYEMWFNDTDGTTEGAIDYADNADHAKFFYNREGVSTSSNNAHEFLETNLYGDTEAEEHNFYSMSVGSGSQITFTIPDERYLTLMVAKNNSTDTWVPAIDLSGKLAGGGTWSTALSSATPLATNHNFGAAGEISKKGRIIRYKLAAGTYTLTGNNAPYWLYYMRVSKEKKDLQEVRQLEGFTYELTWSNSDVGEEWMYEEEHPEATTYFYVQGGNNQKQMNFKITSSGSYTINSSSNDFNINNQQVSENGSVNLQRDNNAGKFTVSRPDGIVAESDKYYHFYERYTSKRDFEIRNPFRVGLYRDTNWSTHNVNANRFAISSLAYGGTALVNFIGPFATAEYSTRPKFQVIDWTLHGHGDQFVQINDDSFELKTETYIANQGEWQPHPGSGWGYVVELGKMTMDNNYDPKNRDLVVKVISEESGMSYGETNRIMGEERTIVFKDVFQPSLDVTFCSDRNGTNLQSLKSGQQFYIKLNVHESIPAIDTDGQSNRTQIVLDLQCPGATLAVTDNNTPHGTNYDGEITPGSFTKNNDGKFVLTMGYRTHANGDHKVYEPITEYYLGLTPTFDSVTENTVDFTIDSDNFTIEKLTLGEHTETLQVERNLPTVGLSVTPNDATIDYQNSRATTLTLTKPEEVTSVTIQLASNIFNVTTQAAGATLTTTDDGRTYTLTGATVTEIPLTFTLKEGVNLGNYTLPVNVTFTGEGTNVNVNQTSASIDVSIPEFTITAGTPSLQTLYYDSSNDELKKTTVRVTVPAGVKDLNITGADIFDVSTTSSDLNTQSGTSYTINDATSSHTIDFTFTATAAGTRTIKFSGSGDNIKVNPGQVSVVVKATPTLQIEASADKVYLDDENKSITITATVPDEVPDEYANTALTSLTLAQSPEIFDVVEETTSGKTRTYTLTLKASVTEVTSTTITISGNGNDYLNVPTKKLVIGVGATRPTETLIWEGSEVFTGLGESNFELKPANAFSNAGLAAGMKLHIYVTPTVVGGVVTIELFNGHWEKLNAWNPTNGVLTINVDQDLATTLTTITDWGYCMVIQANDCTLTKITVSSQ